MQVLIALSCVVMHQGHAIVLLSSTAHRQAHALCMSHDVLDSQGCHVQAQIAAKEQRAAAEQDQQREEAQANAAAEAAYQAKVDATLMTAAPKQYFGRRKVDWYT